MIAKRTTFLLLLKKQTQHPLKKMTTERERFYLLLRNTNSTSIKKNLITKWVSFITIEISIRKILLYRLYKPIKMRNIQT